MKLLRKLRTIKRLMKDNGRDFLGVIFAKLTKTGVFNRLSDEKYISLQYLMTQRKKIDLKKPKLFNEKLQWLKLNNRNPLFTQMVDKYGVRQLIIETIGEQYLVPLIGVWDCFDDINFEDFPNEFVLKCTHDSGSVVICRDKYSFDFAKAKSVLDSHQKKNLFWWAREWPYKNVEARIIAEKLLVDEAYSNLPVYKFFCFNGVPRIIQTIQNDKQDDESVDYFNPKWELLDMRQDYPNSKEPYPKPEQLEKMLDLSEKLSSGFPFLRVDFYVVNQEIYFSEFTFFSDAGIASFKPEKWDRILGEWIDLSSVGGTQ